MKDPGQITRLLFRQPMASFAYRGKPLDTFSSQSRVTNFTASPNLFSHVFVHPIVSN